jgi:hypothetical protein
MTCLEGQAQGFFVALPHNMFVGEDDTLGKLQANLISTIMVLSHCRHACFFSLSPSAASGLDDMAPRGIRPCSHTHSSDLTNIGTAERPEVLHFLYTLTLLPSAACH